MTLGRRGLYGTPPRSGYAGGGTYMGLGHWEPQSQVVTWLQLVLGLRRAAQEGSLEDQRPAFTTASRRVIPLPPQLLTSC